jgi:hypothetical protein
MSFYFLLTCLVVIADMFQSKLVIVRLDTTLSKYNDMSYQDNGKMRLRFCVLFPDHLFIYKYIDADLWNDSTSVISISDQRSLFNLNWYCNKN